MFTPNWIMPYVLRTICVFTQLNHNWCNWYQNSKWHLSSWLANWLYQAQAILFLSHQHYFDMFIFSSRLFSFSMVDWEEPVECRCGAILSLMELCWKLQTFTGNPSATHWFEINEWKLPGAAELPCGFECTKLLQCYGADEAVRNQLNLLLLFCSSTLLKWDRCILKW